MGAAAGGAAAAAAAATIQAIKASGVVVKVSADDFLRVVKRNPEALVVHATTRVFRTQHQYLTTYKGFAFFTKATTEVNMPRGVEMIEAKSIWTPS